MVGEELARERTYTEKKPVRREWGSGKLCVNEKIAIKVSDNE